MPDRSGAEQAQSGGGEFDFSTVQTAVASVFGTNVDVGKGIQSMMVKRIAQDGKFTVVERKKIATILKEQDFDASNRVKKGTGARIGQVRGADFALMGDIVVFGRDDRRTGGGGGVVVGGVGVGGGGYKGTGKAVVVLDYRLVDNETSEIIGVGRGAGRIEAYQQGLHGRLLRGRRAGGRRVRVERVQLRRDHYRGSGAGRVRSSGAGRRGADRGRGVGAEGSGGRGAGGRYHRFDDDDQRGLAGRRPGGDTLTVFHKGKEIKDPATGEVLDVQVDQIGTLTIRRCGIASPSVPIAAVPRVREISFASKRRRRT